MYKNFENASENTKDTLNPEKIKEIKNLIKSRKDMMIATHDLCPNNWNINKMGKEFHTALKNAISNLRIGQTLPILIMDNPPSNTMGNEPYCIVDGYHRWLAHIELGIDEIRCIHLGDISIEDAKIITVMDNRLRGTTTEVGLYGFVKDLNTDYSAYELLNMTPIEVEEHKPDIPDDIINSSSAYDIPENTNKIDESKHISDLRQQIEAKKQEQKQELAQTISNERTIPLTFFPKLSQANEVSEGLNKIKDQDKLLTKEDALLHCIRVCLDIRHRESVAKRFEKAETKKEKEQEEKEERKKQRELKRAEKKKEKELNKTKKPKKTKKKSIE